MRRALVLLVLLVAATAAAEPAPAPAPDKTPSPEALQLFEQGRALAKAGKYAEACDAFAQAYARDQGVGIELNLADCREHLGRLALAYRGFEDAAARSEKAGDAARAKFARDRATALAPKLATVVVKLARADLAGVTVAIAGQRVPAAAIVTERVEIALAPPAPAAGEVAAPATPRRARRDRRRVELAIGLGAGGVLALGTSLALGASARGLYDKYADDPEYCTKVAGELACSPAGTRELGRAQARADVATAFGVGAALLVAGAAVVFVTAPKETVVAPVATRTSLGLAVAGRF